uniref:Membrane-associated protein n=1 Tax=Heterorhabditis bacteriophora TaxID=37862 RepID=A0A1I7WPY7_HETBA
MLLMKRSLSSVLLAVFVLQNFLVVIDAQFVVEVLEPLRMGVRRTVQKCEATGANFGADIVNFSFGHDAIGYAAIPVPPDACTDTTAFHVQRVFHALVVYNDEGKPPIDMAGSKYADSITIPVLMISYSCMVAINLTYPASQGYMIQVKISPGYYDLFRYLIPFVVVVGFCFVVLLVSLLSSSLFHLSNNFYYGFVVVQGDSAMSREKKNCSQKVI